MKYVLKHISDFLYFNMDGVNYCLEINSFVVFTFF